MNTGVAIVIGIIIGFVGEWIVDWLFWRRADAAGQGGAEVDSIKEQLRISESENAALREKLFAARSRTPEVVVKEVVKTTDRLQKIKGIGDVYARKLNTAGINSFADLGQFTPEQLETIIKPEEWQTINPAAWIAEARQFAAKANNA